MMHVIIYDVNHDWYVISSVQWYVQLVNIVAVNISGLVRTIAITVVTSAG